MFKTTTPVINDRRSKIFIKYLALGCAMCYIIACIAQFWGVVKDIA